jgi:acetoin utilization protein AcuB
MRRHRDQEQAMEARVKAFMSGDPVSLDPDASALDAFERMLERGIRHLPVVDGERRVVGVLSIEDLRSAMPFPLSLRRPLGPGERDTAREWRVGEIMTHAPETLGPEASLAEAAERMAERRIGCLPVVDEAGRLAGLLSETDVLWALATSLGLRKGSTHGPRHGELETLVAELRRERERIRSRLATREAGERSLEEIDRETPLDQAERGADLTEINAAHTLDELAVRRLAALDHALDRAGQGTLGVCERCGGAIPVPRLRALPGTTVCVACARSSS